MRACLLRPEVHGAPRGHSAPSGRPKSHITHNAQNTAGQVARAESKQRTEAHVHKYYNPSSSSPSNPSPCAATRQDKLPASPSSMTWCWHWPRQTSAPDHRPPCQSPGVLRHWPPRSPGHSGRACMMELPHRGGSGLGWSSSWLLLASVSQALSSGCLGSTFGTRRSASSSALTRLLLLLLRLRTHTHLWWGLVPLRRGTWQARVRTLASACGPPHQAARTHRSTAAAIPTVSGPAFAAGAGKLPVSRGPRAPVGSTRCAKGHPGPSPHPALPAAVFVCLLLREQQIGQPLQQQSHQSMTALQMQQAMRMSTSCQRAQLLPASQPCRPAAQMRRPGLRVCASAAAIPVAGSGSNGNGAAAHANAVPAPAPATAPAPAPAPGVLPPRM